MKEQRRNKRKNNKAQIPCKAGPMPYREFIICLSIRFVVARIKRLIDELHPQSGLYGPLRGAFTWIGVGMSVPNNAFITLWYVNQFSQTLFCSCAVPQTIREYELGGALPPQTNYCYYESKGSFRAGAVQNQCHDFP